MNRVAVSALLGSALFLPGAALAQSPECDRLVALLEQNQAAQQAVPLQDAQGWQTERNEAQCTTALQQVAQQGGQPAESPDANATPEAQDGQQGGAANIVVQQPAPTISVDQATPQITVNQPQPTVSVRQPQPEIIVRQPAPVVTIDIPQPEIIVRMPQPEVSVQQAQPEVTVQQAQPQVRVEQPEQPEVQVQESQPAQVQLAQPEGQANVQVEQTGEPQVTYERAEPQVTINQAEGQPTVTVEQMQGQPGDAPADQAARDAAAQGLRDSQDPNGTPEAQEGTGGQQQAAATQAGQAPAGGQMQPIAIGDLEGMDVVSERGEQLGDVGGVVQNTADSKMYVVINQGGFLGVGEKQVALSADGLLLQGDRLVVPGLSDEQIRNLPEFQANDQFPEVEDSEIQIRAAAQQ